MNVKIEEKYSDILQHVESAIMTVHESRSELVDGDVLVASDRKYREKIRVKY